MCFLPFLSIDTPLLLANTLFHIFLFSNTILWHGIVPWEKFVSRVNKLPYSVKRVIVFCCTLPFWWFAGLWILCSDVSATYEDGTDTVCFETSAHKIQKPGNHPKEGIHHSEQGERLKSRIVRICVEHCCMSSNSIPISETGVDA